MTERVTLETSLSVEEVRRRLADRLVSRAGLVDTIFRNAEVLSNPNAERPEGIKFSGTVSDGGFQLIRWVPYNNSFRPGLRGSLRAGGKGTIIDIDLQSTPVWTVAAVATVAWILVAIVAGELWLSAAKLSLGPELIVPALVGLVITLVFSIAPRIEAQKLLRGFARVVGASENG